MRYRALDVAGDYSIGRGQANFLINSPACVAQSVLTRLRLWEGEWFLDLTSGTPWLQQILGKHAKSIYDLAIRTRILDTQGVTGIEGYASALDAVTRKLSVTTLSVSTIYGPAKVV
jgi:hypothetical protein